MISAEKYQQLYDSMVIRTEFQGKSDALAKSIQLLFPKYQAASDATGIPKAFIAIVHSLECSSRFDRHLHNGDMLSQRTTHVPAGRPVKGNPPFSWTDSAIDALQLRNLHKWSDWSIPSMLLQLEKYNGLGYQKRNVVSPYLWSWSNHYLKGKYESDGKYNPELVSKQCGAAVLLKLFS